MAAIQSTKPKSAPKANTATKTKTQLHRRSRTGCYTCRLRRKKCDEGTLKCSACKHLGLECEYRRPSWWSNNDARKQRKDEIKTIIKRKKLSGKSTHTIQTTVTTPPGLSHSLPTSATLSDPLERGRSGSIDSHFSSAFNFNSPPTEFDAFGSAQVHPGFMFDAPYYPYPYAIDVKTERQMFVNDVPTLKESTISTFNTIHTPPPPGTVLPSGEWAEQVVIELDETDQRLLDHFIQAVLPTIFPILDSNQHGSVGSDLVLPALQTNRSYLHCCLGIAAQHLKATSVTSDDIDQDIMRHRYATISTLCEALSQDENHQEILEATLGLIFFQSIVGRLDDGLPDIPWHQHFQAAVSLVQKLDLPRLVADPTQAISQTPFNMTLTSWIDIIGAAMQGTAPMFAHTYREKHLSGNPSLGLRELMGCDDKVMYLISEIACLEALKRDGMDDMILCQHVHALGDQIGLTEIGECGPKIPFNANGTLSPKQLSKNMTAAFRLAARIYLCSLVPGFNPAQSSCMGLVDKLTTILQFIPSGPHGFDRSLVWVYLIGGSVSLPGSNFRMFLEERLALLGDVGNFGAMGRVATLLQETWMQTEAQAKIGTPTSEGGETMPYIHWRDVMQMKGWDFLLL
ncbi:unnamed protein product [Parascedosporium putredinis]|uniref:Zn(2)-C6 fungal-type domain-containing protein n=1 Tax=Parascedosporium putredinis TaxID=1442378 RepID=A0A9P1H5M0_9PEZI|nr:unnamed protein product [Parascedosporium putredinis]CAI7998061.1 unnamed protein product [Parascedosporium putredinis]